MTARGSRTPAQFVTIAEAAQRSSCSPKTIRRYIAAGHLTAYRMGPKLIRLDVEELDALMRPLPTVGTLR